VIELKYTVIYKSSQNGVAERAIQTIKKLIKLIFKDAELPLEF
jgi:hypothetical protein